MMKIRAAMQAVAPGGTGWTIESLIHETVGLIIVASPERAD